jgi:hypothetical protein
MYGDMTRDSTPEILASSDQFSCNVVETLERLSETSNESLKYDVEVVFLDVVVVTPPEESVTELVEREDDELPPLDEPVWTRPNSNHDP